MLLLRFSRYPWVKTALPPTPPELGARTCRAEAGAEAGAEADAAAAEFSSAPEFPISAATEALPVPASPFVFHRSSSPRMTAASARLRSDVSDNASKSLGASPSADFRSDTW